MNGPPPTENFFRHEFGRLVAMLSRRLGVQHLEVIEDAVQSALLIAVESWPKSGLPENPSAWLFRVAQNRAVGELRSRARRERLADLQGSVEPDGAPGDANPLLSGDVGDDLLRMLLVCCDDALPVESQLILALRTLCGFDVREIAERLFLSEANVYKRLGRARARLRDLGFLPDALSEEQLALRVPAVRTILYLLFTEGYLSSRAECAIRRDLCEEARRLALVLADHSAGAGVETSALLALMHFHLARLAARQDQSGGLLLLQDQDRTLFDEAEIQSGLIWLEKSARGEVFSRYHAEAGIAAEHCLAPSFAETRWDRIAECYELLEKLAPSPIHTLNRALAVAEVSGPAQGLLVLEGLVPPLWLEGSHLWAAVLSDLHRRCAHNEDAGRYGRAAIEAAPSPAVKELLQRRLQWGGG